MLDIGWTELVVIAIVLIVVVGPKDLPPMLRAFGRMTSKLRGMASDFRQQFDEALREAELDDVKKTIDDARRLNPANAIREAINPLRQAGQDIRSDIEKAARVDNTTTSAAASAVSTAPATPGEPMTTDTVAAGLGFPSGTAVPEVPVGQALHSDALPVSTTTAETPKPAAAPTIKGEPAKADTVAAAARSSAAKQLKRLDEAEAKAKADDTIEVAKPARAPRKTAKAPALAEEQPAKTRARKKAEILDAGVTVEAVAKKPRAPRKTKTTTGDEA